MAPYSNFEDFRGYIDFFLLQDIVTDDYTTLRFHAPFLGFDRSPVPADLDEYLAYRSEQAIESFRTLTVSYAQARSSIR